MTSFGPDFSKLIDGKKTTPNPGIHQEGGPTGSNVPGSLPVTSDQIKTVSKGIAGGVMRDTAVALGNVVPSTGDVHDDAFQALSEWGGGVQSDLTLILGEVQQVKFGLITLADLASTRRRVPYWVSPNPFEYVSFPRALVKRDDGTKPVFTIPAGTLALGAVTIEEATTNNQVRFIAGGNTPPTHVYVGLWKVDQTTGDLTMVYNFGDVRSEIDTGSLTYEVALEMTTDMLLDEGEIMMVGILPVGGSFTVGAVTRQQIVPSPVLYPQAATELLSGLTTLPASDIADSALDHTSTHRILVSVGQALPETISPIYGTIDFDTYGNTNDWVSSAVVNFKSSSPARWRILDGVLTAYGTENFGALDYEIGFIVKQKCATDDMFSEFVVGSGWTNVVTRSSRTYVHCANDGSSAVGLFVAQDGTGNAAVTIQTVTSMSTRTGTVRATGTDVFSAVVDDVFRLEAVADELTGQFTYTGYRNGDPITDCTWTDLSGVAPSGVAWRRAGYGSGMFTNLNVRYYAAGADEFRFGDLSAAA
jgi:hypothetical protein